MSPNGSKFPRAKLPQSRDNDALGQVMHPLKGKAIVVTGAGRGIGAAYATHLAALGARVVVNDVGCDAAQDAAAAIRSNGGEAIACVADIVDWEQARRLIDCCIDGFGRIDGLVNNAALFSVGRLDEYQPGSFEQLLGVNVIGTLNCAAHAVKPMIAQGSGSIVNVTSGAHMGIPTMGCYGASKGAVASLTYSWAAELAGTGVRVNAISPMAQTAMGDVLADYMREHGHEPHSSTLLPESNAGVAAFLLSDEAAAINGQIVRIEGQYLSLVAHPAVALPLRFRDEGWDYAAVRDAFAQDLAARQMPLGVMGVEIETFRPASQMWDNNKGGKAGG